MIGDLVGRATSNAIQLDDETVANVHCRISELVSGNFLLRDESLDGTWVNGERVRGELGLRDGDVIRIAATSCRYLAR